MVAFTLSTGHARAINVRRMRANVVQVLLIAFEQPNTKVRWRTRRAMLSIGVPIIEENGRGIAALSVSHFDYPPDPKRMENFQ